MSGDSARAGTYVDVLHGLQDFRVMALGIRHVEIYLRVMVRNDLRTCADHGWEASDGGNHV